MKTSPLVALALIGCVLGDTSSHAHTSNLVSSVPVAEAAASNVYSNQAQVDNSLYYNNYQQQDPYNQGYYDYNTEDQSLFPSQEADRQDILGTGLTFAAVIPVITIFTAALAGALVAPAVSTAARSLFNFAAEIPNIEINLPGDEVEVNEIARSLTGGSGMWSRVLTNVASNLVDEFNTKYKGKFEKLLQTNNL